MTTARDAGADADAAGVATGRRAAGGSDTDATDWPTVELVPWTGPVDPDHPDANFLADVATASLADPMATLERLAGAVGIPVGALARAVLVKWTTAGSEAVLAVGPAAIERLRDLAGRLVALDGDEGSAATRASVLADLVEQIQWLAHGIDEPASTYPAGGADVE